MSGEVEVSWPHKGGFKGLFNELRGKGVNVERYIQDFLSRESPLYHYIGLEILEIREGYAKTRLPYKREILRFGGMVHGGIVMTVIDNVAGLAVMTVNEGTNQFTVELKINFLEPLVKGPFTCIGRVLRAGRRIAVAEGEVLDVEGRLCAKGVGTWYMVRD